MSLFRPSADTSPLDMNRAFSPTCIWCDKPIGNNEPIGTIGGEPIHNNCFEELCEAVREDEEEQIES